VGALASIGTVHGALDVSRYVMMHSMLFAVVFAELTIPGARIVFYRWGG